MMLVIRDTFQKESIKNTDLNQFFKSLDKIDGEE